MPLRKKSSRGPEVLWWLSRLLMAACASFFVLFGIYVSIASFYLQDPFSFMMSFIASTMIILISAAILAGLIASMVKALRPGEDDENGKP